MILKNQEYEGEVVGFGTDGEGIIKIEGATVFVPFCLTGEKVRFKILKVKGDIAYGKLVSVLKPSYSRVNPPCPVFGKCGGCDLQHMNYEVQLEFKRDSVYRALSKLGGIYAQVNDIVACSEPFGYRNKAVLPIGKDEDGNAAVGFYARHSHRIIGIDGCLIQAEWFPRVVTAVKSFANGLKSDALRHMVVREIKGSFIFALVAVNDLNVNPLISGLEKSFENFTFLLNINDSAGNAIFGKEWRICRGEGFFGAEECGIKYKAGASTFLQVNDDVRAKLYNKILEEVGENTIAVDLYSGGGMLTAMLAKKCGKAYGIEVIEEASRCADELKFLNGLQGAMHNVCGKVEEKIDCVFAETEGSSRVIVCDPPRKGMERSVVKAIVRSGAEKIILVSCNPATLARDLGLLCGTLEERDGALVKSASPQSAYEIESVTPFDMFPQTKWCETLVVLSKKIPEGRISRNNCG